MWHKAEYLGHSMRLKLTFVGLLVKLANRYTNEGIAFYIVEWSQLLLSKTNHCICYQSFAFTQRQVLLFNTNYSGEHYSFICTQFNDSKYFYVSLTSPVRECRCGVMVRPRNRRKRVPVALLRCLSGKYP